MSRLKKAIVVISIHLLLLGTMAGKYAYDRATRPRLWVKTMGYDPDLPLRGRYVSLSLEVETNFPVAAHGTDYVYYDSSQAHLEVREGKLWAITDQFGTQRVTYRPRNQQPRAVLADPVLFFLPEHVEDPTWRKAGEELWAEVTIPRKGPPRPIQLGIKKGDGPIVPLALD